MSGLETKMAVDVLKPASGFIDALLGPKIAKVRKWAIEKDLAGHFEKPERLTQLLERYIDRTIRRASSLSTLVFPQERVPFGALYEPVTLVRKEGIGGAERGGEYNLDLESEGNCFLIVDEAGMGKSTFAKHICLEVIGRTDKVPVLFDLVDFDNTKPLVENLVKDFDDIDCEFDRQLFRKLLAQGRFFVILDGFDEISSSSQDLIRSEIKSFNEKKGNTSLIITSRPQERIPSLIGAVSLSLRHLSPQQAISIFEKYDHLSKSEIGQKLQGEMDRIPGRFLETPLLVSLLYRTYGFNNSIAEKVSVFYAEIYEALYKGHDLTKAGYLREKQCGLDIDNFRKLLRAFSFLYIVKGANNKQVYDWFLGLVEDAQRLCAFPSIVSRKFLDDLLLAVPLMSRDGLSLKFMHRSIAEYFAAEYIANREGGKLLLTEIIASEGSETFSGTIEYLYELAPGLYREVIIAPLAEQFLDETSTDRSLDVYETLSFSHEWAISLWRFNDVKGGKRGLNIPRPPYVGASQWYMYGSINGERYVASCATRKRRNLPDGAWQELTEQISEGKKGLEIMCLESDENIAELGSRLQAGIWYQSDSDEVRGAGNTRALKELIIKENLIRLSRRANNEELSARVITRARCDSVIESVRALRVAESNIAELLRIR